MSADTLDENRVALMRRNSLRLLDLHCQMKSQGMLDIIRTAGNLEVLKCRRLGKLSPGEVEIGGGLKLRKLVLMWDQPITPGGKIVSIHSFSASPSIDE